MRASVFAQCCRYPPLCFNTSTLNEVTIAELQGIGPWSSGGCFFAVAERTVAAVRLGSPGVLAWHPWFRQTELISSVFSSRRHGVAPGARATAEEGSLLTSMECLGNVGCRCSENEEYP